MSLQTQHVDWINLLDAHELLCTTPGPDDKAVQQMIDDLSALIAAYLERNLLDGTYEQTFVRPSGPQLFLEAWPVTSITSITQDGVALGSDEYQLDSELGLILNDCATYSRYDPCGGDIVVTFRAGYATPPREIQAIFRTLLTDRYESDGDSASGTTGDIKRVSLTGLGTVEFGTEGISYSGVDRQSGIPEELKDYVGILDRYRSERSMGVVV